MARTVASVPLATVAEVIRGVTFKKGDASDYPSDESIPVLRAGNIGNLLHLDRALVWIPSVMVSSSQLLRPGDIVMCTSSGSSEVIGKSAFLEQTWYGTVGAFCAIIRPNPSECYPAFLALFLQTKMFRNWTRRATGANIKNLRKGELEHFPVPRPALTEQRRIARVLSRSVRLADKNANANAVFREFHSALFVKMFGDPVANPRGWKTARLEEAIGSGPQNGLYRPASDYGSGTPILRIDCILDGQISHPSTWKRVRLDYDTVTNYALKENDIIINRVNSRPLLGKSAIVPEVDGLAVFESNMMRLAVDASRVHPKFLIAMLQVNSMRKRLLLNAKDAINQSSINQSDVRSLPILVPPLGLQSQFVATLPMAQSIVTTLGAASEATSALKASLFSRLFDYSLI